MHTCQILLVEAESHEEALDKVASAITHSEERYPNWSDWHDTSPYAGRWDNFFGKGKNVLRYTENQTLAEQKLQDWIGGRKAEMLRHLEEVKTLDLAAQVDAYNTEKNQPFDGDGMKLYYLKKLASLLQDDWTMDTGVYDLEQHTGNLQYFRERLAVAPEMQYLVPVDFHF
jgi:hypothetical protein